MNKTTKHLIFTVLGIIIIIIEIVSIVDTIRDMMAEPPATTCDTADTTEIKPNIPQINPDYYSLRNAEQYYEIVDSIRGDFDGNGTLEYLYLFIPKDEFMDYLDNIFVFSDTSIKPLENIEGYLWVDLKNLGDINLNGTDEIFIYTGSRQILCTCWRCVEIYTLTDTGWTDALERGGFFIVYSGEMEDVADKYYPFVKVDKKKKGFVKITYNAAYDEDIDMEDDYYWAVKHKWVPLKKIKKNNKK